MSLNDKIEWTIEAANWTDTLFAAKNLEPMEIATEAIERAFRFKKAFNVSTHDYILGLGIIIMVSHADMTSPDEIFVCHTPTVLANAGLYTESETLQNLIDKLLKHK